MPQVILARPEVNIRCRLSTDAAQASILITTAIGNTEAVAACGRYPGKTRAIGVVGLSTVVEGVAGKDRSRAWRVQTLQNLTDNHLMQSGIARGSTTFKPKTAAAFAQANQCNGTKLTWSVESGRVVFGRANAPDDKPVVLPPHRRY